MKPTVGLPSDEYRAVCSYRPTPYDPVCPARATLHVRVVDDYYGTVGLETCDTHASIARAAGRFVAEHEHAGVCGLPGTIWADAENVCVLDDSGEEPALVRASLSRTDTDKITEEAS